VPVVPSLSADLARACEGKGRNDLAVTAPRGGVLRVNNLWRNYFDRAVARAELEFDSFTPHDLRDTAASLAIASGANMEVVQLMPGHESAALTLDRYGTLFSDALDEVTARMDSARENARVPRAFRGLEVVPLHHDAREVASDQG
jgi:integrase